MNQYLLYVSPDKGKDEILSWQNELNSRGIVLLRAASLREAVCCCRAYHLMMILLELDGAGDSALETVRSLVNASANDRHPPLVGIAQGLLPDDEVKALAEAGMVDIISRGVPDHFIFWHLEILAALENLSGFAQARMDVVELASQTRMLLHELSQPLSAVQGRLQLLAARCPKGDPNEQTYQDLVRQILSVTQQVIAMQQLHRQFS
jgi:signal transduction histidine kinase